MAKRYPKEFKLEAVRLSELPDRTAVSVAEELDIKVETLYSWRNAGTPSTISNTNRNPFRFPSLDK